SLTGHYCFYILNGSSDEGQANVWACWSVLLKRYPGGYENSSTYNVRERWNFFSFCLMSLQEIERDERFLYLLSDVIKRVTSKDALKFILIDEKKRNLLIFNEPKLKEYDKNLTALIQILE
ncbi:MAG: hypothetical protein KDC05_16825, partial [Bacteroidales bacterium]|nr:hypothetical protein [Bacteroidales bacterium]